MSEPTRLDRQIDVRDRLVAQGADPHLLDEYWQGLQEVRNDEIDDLTRRIGYLLVRHGQADLWQLAYIEYLGGQRDYCLGDETLFLLNQPVSD